MADILHSLVLAALGESVKAVLCYAPVTNLSVLSEFKGSENSILVTKNNLTNWVDRIPLISLYMNISCTDDRVSTKDALTFFTKLYQAGKLKDNSKLSIYPLAGHASPPEPGKTEEAINWLIKE